MGKRKFPDIPADLLKGAANEIALQVPDKTGQPQKPMPWLKSGNKPVRAGLSDSRYKIPKPRPIEEGVKS